MRCACINIYGIPDCEGIGKPAAAGIGEGGFICNEEKIVDTLCMRFDGDREDIKADVHEAITVYTKVGESMFPIIKHDNIQERPVILRTVSQVRLRMISHNLSTLHGNNSNIKAKHTIVDDIRC